MTKRQSLYNDNDFIPDNLNTLICGDSLEVLKRLPKRSVFTITDPPYGIGESHEKRSKMNKGGYGEYPAGETFSDIEETWDNQKIDSAYIHQIIRVSKKIVMFGGQVYADLLPANYGWIIWDKVTGGSFLSDGELAYTNFLNSVRRVKYKYNGMIQELKGKDKEPRFHPTQKPLAVMTWIIENFTDPEDVIFDPFAGAGSTLIAAKNLGRAFIGVEQNQEYCNRAESRLAQEILNFKEASR